MKTSMAATAFLLAAVCPAAAAEIKITPMEKIEYKAVFGQVESKDAVTARARIGGTVLDLRVEEGDDVKSGDVVAVVADDKLSIQVKAIDARMAALQAQLANARTDLGRAQRLVQSGVAPKKQLDDYQTQVSVLNNQIVALQAEKAVVDQQSAEGEVLAPTAGRVIAVPVTKGTVIMAGESVARIAGGGYFLRLALPERHAAHIIQGDDVLVGQRGDTGDQSTDSTPDTSLKGKLVKVYPEIQNGRVTADVEVANLGNFFVGERTRVWIPVGKREVVAVPKAALSTRYGVDYVKVSEGGQIDDVAVIVGDTFVSAAGEQVEILSGLAAGDTVITP